MGVAKELIFNVFGVAELLQILLQHAPYMYACPLPYFSLSKLSLYTAQYLQHQQDLYHVFIDFKKAFDRVWHAALWATMKKYNISTNLILVIKNLYDMATSAVLFSNSIGNWL